MKFKIWGHHVHLNKRRQALGRYKWYRLAFQKRYSNMLNIIKVYILTQTNQMNLTKDSREARHPHTPHYFLYLCHVGFVISAPTEKISGGSIQSSGRNKCDHRLLLISFRQPVSVNIPTLKWHFQTKKKKEKQFNVEPFLCLCINSREICLNVSKDGYHRHLKQRTLARAMKRAC